MSEYIINFQNGRTGEHIATVSGKQAKFLMDHSDFLKTLVDINSSQKTFTIPIDFPHGRTEIFKKIIRGQPVGKYVYDHGHKSVVWNSLSDEEEALIAKDLQNGTLRSTVQKERQRVLYEVLHYLMLDPTVEERFLKIENVNNSNKERLRRKNITRKRVLNVATNLAGENESNNYYLMEKAREKAIPFLNEDTIEKLIEKHKNYLYGRYAPHSKRELEKYMSKKNIEKRNTIQEERTKQMKLNLERQQKNLERRQSRRLRRGRAYNNNNNNNNNESEWWLMTELNNARRDPFYFYKGGPYNEDTIRQTNLAPFQMKSLNKLSNIEFERYLRSLRKEGEEKYLPYQGPLVGNLYGNTNVY